MEKISKMHDYFADFINFICIYLKYKIFEDLSLHDTMEAKT